MRLLIYGSSDFGKVLRELVELCGHHFSGFIDDVNPGATVLGGYSDVKSKYPPADFGIVIAIGYKHLAARWSVFEQVVSDGYATPSLVHPVAYVSAAESVGKGSIVMAHAIVDVFAQVGECCVLWPGANVSHNSSIGSNSFLSPNSTVCGFSSVGRNSFVGAGAVIADHCAIPDGSFIKAGSVSSMGRAIAG